MKNTTIFFLLLITFSGFIPVSVFAAEPIEISQEMIDSQNTLTGNSNSHVVNSEITIPAGKEFVIRDGAELLFDGGIFSVRGSLVLKGSAEKAIKISSTDLDGISPLFRIFEGGEITMEFAHSNAGKRQMIESIGGKSTIVHSRFQNSDAPHSYISAFRGSVLHLADNLFENISAPYVLEMFNNTKGDIRQTSFEQSGNSTVIALYDGWNSGGKSAAIFSDVVIKNSSAKGIEVYGGATFSADNLAVFGLLKNAIAVYTKGNVEIKNSNFENNAVAVESYDSNTSIVQSSIEGNTNGGVISYGGNTDVKNNWWGSKDGPKSETGNPSGTGQSVTGDAIFSPWLTEKPYDKKCCSSVLFIPGIQGSRLYLKKLIENQLWEPNTNADVKKLFLTSEGESVEKNIYTQDIIEKTNLTGGLFDLSVYDTFANSMKDLVAQGIMSDWTAIPYDWRYSPEQIVSMDISLAKNATTSLLSIFSELARGSKTGKVAIVSHSNGGLVAKSLIKKLSEIGRASEIDQLIMVAAPEHGTPQTIADMLHGDNQSILGGIVLSKTTARDLAKNMPAAYALLPSQKYFDYAYSPAVTFNVDSDPSVSPSSKYGFTMTNRDQLGQFLTAASGDRLDAKSTDQPAILNSSLLANSARFHEEIDNFFSSSSSPLSGLIKVTSIVGVGNQTITGMIYKHLKKRNRVDIDRTPVTSDDGDGVVLAGDASVRSGDVYQIDLRGLGLANQANYKHMNIMDASSTQKMIAALIQNNLKTLPPFVSKKTSSTNTWKRYEFSVHSPVSIVAYDSSGRRTGLLKAPTEEDIGVSVEEIPGSQYMNFGEGKTVITAELPSRIEIDGLDTGTFTFIADEFEGGKRISSVRYSDIPVIEGVTAEFIPASSSVMMIDYDGDENTDKNILPDSSSSNTDFISALVSSKQVISTEVKSRLLVEKYTKELDLIERVYRKKGIEFAMEELNKEVKSLSTSLRVYNLAQKKMKVVKVNKLVEPIARDTTVIFFEFQKLAVLAESI